jgi:hypothetical protein
MQCHHIAFPFSSVHRRKPTIDDVRAAIIYQLIVKSLAYIANFNYIIRQHISTRISLSPYADTCCIIWHNVICRWKGGVTLKFISKLKLSWKKN